MQVKGNQRLFRLPGRADSCDCLPDGVSGRAIPSRTLGSLGQAGQEPSRLVLMVGTPGVCHWVAASWHHVALGCGNHPDVSSPQPLQG